MPFLITNEIEKKIIYINELIRFNKFNELHTEGYLTESKPEDIKRVLVEYFNNDKNVSNLKKISPPSKEFIQCNAATFFITPKKPDPNQWRIELNLIINDIESDLTAIYYLDTSVSPEKVQLYDLLIQ